MNKKKIILVIFLYFFTSNSSFSIEADVFVQSTVNRASKILSENLSKDEKIEKLKIIAEETVDIKGIGFYTLGSIRKNLDGDQKKKYSRLFREYFLKSFSSRLSEYTDPKINVISQEIINDKYTIVSSILEADEKRPEIKIEWRVYTINPDNLLVRDLIIEGLSLARTQREEFNSIIQNGDGDIEILFSSLKTFINQ